MGSIRTPDCPAPSEWRPGTLPCAPAARYRRPSRASLAVRRVRSGDGVVRPVHGRCGPRWLRHGLSPWIVSMDVARRVARGGLCGGSRGELPVGHAVGYAARCAVGRRTCRDSSGCGGAIHGGRRRGPGCRWASSVTAGLCRRATSGGCAASAARPSDEHDRDRCAYTHVCAVERFRRHARSPTISVDRSRMRSESAQAQAPVEARRAGPPRPGAVYRKASDQPGRSTSGCSPAVTIAARRCSAWFSFVNRPCDHSMMQSTTSASRICAISDESTRWVTSPFS